MGTKRRGLLGIVFALALAAGLLPGMALTAYAETQVVQVNYRYNDNMVLTNLEADFYDDDSLKSMKATYTWGWGTVGGHSLVLVDTLIPEKNGYSATYPYWDGDPDNHDDQDNWVKTFDASMTRVGQEAPGINFVAHSGATEQSGYVYDGSNNKTLNFSQGQVPSNVNQSYYLFLWTYRLDDTWGNCVYPDYLLAKVIVYEGKIYTAQGSANPESATEPNISTPPKNLDLSYGYTEDNILTVATDEIEGHTLSYQWYSNTTNSTEGGSKIEENGTSSTYTVPTGKDAGNYYYYCVVTATKTGNSLPATKTSDVVKVTINKQAAPTLTEGQKPTAKTGLVYTGSEQELVTAPTDPPAGYTLKYSLDGTTWSTDIPKGTDAKDYTVKVKYVGDNNHMTFDGDDIPVTITKKVGPGLTNEQKPKAKEGLTYSSQPQPLVMAPTVVVPKEYTEIVYALGDVNGPKGEYAASIPTATEAGTYHVWYKVLGDENHSGVEAKCIDVSIAKADISKAQVTIATKSYTYDGKAKKPAVKSVVLNGKKLNAKTDYTVKYANNKKLGKATVTVAGKGDYAGTAKATFAIGLGKAKLTTIGQAKTRTMETKWAKVAGAKSYQLQWRERGGKWKTVTAKSTKATVKGMQPGKLYDFRVRAVSGKAKGAWSNERHRWFVKQANITTASKKAGTVKASWSKTAKASAGYLVVVRYSKDGPAVAKQAVAAGKTKATFTGLKPGKTAWVLVRALRSADGTNYAGMLTLAKTRVKIAGNAAKAQSAEPQAQPQAADSGLRAAAL